MEQLHLAVFEAEIRGRAVGKELVTVADQMLVHGGHVVEHGLTIDMVGRREVPDAGPIARPLQPPLKRAHHAIVVARGQARLPIVDPAAIVFSHLYLIVSHALPTRAGLDNECSRR